jgi:hypothetical protein
MRPAQGFPGFSVMSKSAALLSIMTGAPMPLHAPPCPSMPFTHKNSARLCLYLLHNSHDRPADAALCCCLLHSSYVLFRPVPLGPCMPLRSKVRLRKFPPSALISPRLQGPSWSQPNRHVQSLSGQTSWVQPQLHFDRCPYDTTFVHCNHAHLLFAAL